MWCVACTRKLSPLLHGSIACDKMRRYLIGAQCVRGRDSQWQRRIRNTASRECVIDGNNFYANFLCSTNWPDNAEFNEIYLRVTERNGKIVCHCVEVRMFTDFSFPSRSMLLLLLRLLANNNSVLSARNACGIAAPAFDNNIHVDALPENCVRVTAITVAHIGTRHAVNGAVTWCIFVKEHFIQR